MTHYQLYGTLNMSNLYWNMVANNELPCLLSYEFLWQNIITPCQSYPHIHII